MREMKDSGVEWIGEIPKEWHITQTRRLFRNEKNIVGDAADEYERLALTLKGVIKRSKNDSEGLQPEKFEGYQILRQNELVFKMIDLENVNTSRVGLSPYTGLVSPAYIVLKNDSDDNRYEYYWFMSMYYNEVFNHLGGDGVRSALNVKDMLSLPIPNISKIQKKMLADYLDVKCSKIDEIIEKQQAIIEKLKEYKLHLIQETVTKGLDRNAELKESGEIWIGKVPKHWAVLKLKSHTKMITPMRDKPEDLSGDIPWVRIEDYNGKYIDSSREGFGVSEQTVKEMNLKVYPVGSILCTSSCDLGKCAIVATSLVSNQRFINIVPDKDTSSDYLYYVMLSNADRMNHLSTGTIQANLSRVAFEHLLIQFPPLEEQKEIARYLDHKVEVIDSTIMGKEKLVEKLREYKKSLIYEVVTGKKEV